MFHDQSLKKYNNYVLCRLLNGFKVNTFKLFLYVQHVKLLFGYCYHVALTLTATFLSVISVTTIFFMLACGGHYVPRSQCKIPFLKFTSAGSIK